MADEEFWRRPRNRRRHHISQVDLIVQRENEVANEQRLNVYFCPCKKCHDGHRQTLRTINSHREKYGRDNHLMFSMLGGEPAGGFPEEGIWVDDNRDFGDEENVFFDADEDSMYAEEMDPYHDVQQ